MTPLEKELVGNNYKITNDNYLKKYVKGYIVKCNLYNLTANREGFKWYAHNERYNK